MSVYKRGDVWWMEFVKGSRRVRRSTGVSNKREFARSPSWVMKQRAMMQLHPEVIKLLEPPQKLPTQVALTLTNLKPDLQIMIAQDIVSKGMRLRTALAHVRKSSDGVERMRKQGGASRKRHPSDDFKILVRFLESLGEQAQVLLGIPSDRVAAMFAPRPPKEKQVIISVLRRRIEQLKRLEEELCKI